MATVKTEKRDDDDEINALAAKMAEANKAKMAQQQQQQQMQVANGMHPAVMIRPGQPAISSFFRATGQPIPVASTVSQFAEDETSKGRFGWDNIQNTLIPYVMREDEKYVAVKLYEVKVLEKFKYFLKPDLYSCTCIRSVYMSEIEARLLNDINVRHCDFYYFKQQAPFNTKDLLVKLSDAKEFYSFLEVCHMKLTKKSTNPNDRCGFYKINGESVVPYTMKEGVKYVPLFYFEGETDNLKTKSEIITGWDLSYLKFCCKVQGIRNELFANDRYAVVSMADIKEHFPPGTEFSEHWPAEANVSLNGNAMANGTSGQWTKKPHSPPQPVSSAPLVLTQGNRLLVSTPQNIVVTTSTAIRNPTVLQTISAQRGLNPSNVQRPQVVTTSGTPVYMAGWQGMISNGFQGQVDLQNLISTGQGYSINPQLLPALLRNGTIQQPRVGGTPLMQANYTAAYPGFVRFPSPSATQPSSPRPGQQVPKPPPALIPVPAGRSPAGTTHSNGSSSPNVYSSQVQTANFRVQKVLIDGKGVPAINRKSNVLTADLVTLNDLTSLVFPELDVEKCKSALEFMGVTDITQPTPEQFQCLKRAGSAAATGDRVYLIAVKDVQPYLTQIKYICSNDNRSKRLKVS